MTKDGKTMHKVVYKPDSQSTEEYIIIVDPEEHQLYKEDKSVALARVVQSFDIWVSEQGSQGLLNKASKQQLAAVFGDKKNEDDIIKTIIENGTPKPGESISKGFSGGNDSRGASKGNAGHGGR